MEPSDTTQSHVKRISLAGSSSRRSSKKCFLELSGLSVGAREKLAKFDINGDGNLDPNEISQIVDTLANEQFRGRHLKYGFLALALVVVVLIGCMFGISWAVFLVNKDTEVQQGVWVTRADKLPIQLGNSQMTVVNGMLSSRDAANAATVSTQPNTVQRPLSANMTTAQLTSLTRVYLSSSTGAQVSLVVTGFRLIAGSPPTLLLSTPSGSLEVSGHSISGSATAGLVGDTAMVWQEVAGIFTK